MLEHYLSVPHTLLANHVNERVLGRVTVGVGAEAKVPAINVLIRHLHQEAIVVPAPFFPFLDGIRNL